MNTRPERDFTNPICQPFLLEGGDHGVLLLHGFTGSAAHMRLIGEGLHAHGFTVMGVNLPGHATYMDDMANFTWEDWLNAAKEGFMALKNRCRYQSVAGLSMGGCLTLLLAQQMQPTAIATISAPMAVRQRLLPLAGLAAPFVPHILWRSREHSPYPVDDRYDYGYPGFPTRSGTDLHRLIRMARRDLHAVQCPLLVVQSRKDETIAPESAEVILAGVGSSKKGMLWLDNVPHVCTISPEHPAITAAIAETFRMAEQNEARPGQ